VDARAARWRACRGGRGGVVQRVRRRHPRAGAAGAARRRARAGPRTRRRVLAPRHRHPRPAEPRPSHGDGAHRHAQGQDRHMPVNTPPYAQLPNDKERHEQHERQRVVAGLASGQTSHTHRLRRLAVTGFIATLAAATVATTLAAALAQAVGVDFEPRWCRNDPVVRIRRGDRRHLGRGHRHCRRSSSLERSPRRAIRVDGSVADRDLVGPAPPLRGKHRHHHRPPRTTPRRCDSNDPHPGQEPPHPDRLTIPFRTQRSSREAVGHWSIRDE